MSESEVSMREYVDRGAVSDSKLEVADTSSILKMYTCFRVVFKNTDTYFWERSSIQPNIFENELGALSNTQVGENDKRLSGGFYFEMIGPD